eukprot:1746598-Rhodomonas_salina.1
MAIIHKAAGTEPTTTRAEKIASGHLSVRPLHSLTCSNTHIGCAAIRCGNGWRTVRFYASVEFNVWQKAQRCQSS